MGILRHLSQLSHCIQWIVSSAGSGSVDGAEAEAAAGMDGSEAAVDAVGDEVEATAGSISAEHFSPGSASLGSDVLLDFIRFAFFRPTFSCCNLSQV